MPPTLGRKADIRDNQVVVVRGAELESDGMADASRQMHWRYIRHGERWMDSSVLQEGSYAPSKSFQESSMSSEVRH